MGRQIIKRIGLIFFALVMLLPCSACLAKNDSGIKTIDTEHALTPDDFDKETNETVKFGNITMQIPNTWREFSVIDGALWLTYGDVNSSKLQEQLEAGEINVITITQLPIPDAAKPDLSDSKLRNTIKDVFCSAYSENHSYTDIKVIQDTYLPENGLFLCAISVRKDDIDTSISSVSVIINGELYIMQLTTKEIDKYNLANDAYKIMCSVQLASIEEEAEPFTERIADPIIEETSEPTVECETEPTVEDSTEPTIDTTGETVTESIEEVKTDPITEPSEDNGRDYVLNTNTKKFHYPSCGSADDIKESNRKEYHGVREEIIEMGYDPCGRCHP